MDRRPHRSKPTIHAQHRRIFCALLGGLMLAPAIGGTGGTSPETQPAAVKATAEPRAPLPAAKLKLVAFENSPFPWRGLVPGTNKPFLYRENGKLRTPTNDYGGYYWEDPTFSDRRSLLYIPKGFDIGQPVVIVVYFHGQRAELLRDVRDRQQVTRQLAESGLSAVLIAPQFAVDAFDSSAGRFWEKGGFAKYLDEAAVHLAALYGNKRVRARFAAAPVVLVAYSGGYHPAAYAAEIGGVDDRLRGMILLDAPYGEEDMLVSWLMRRHADAFFVSVHGMASREYNAQLKRLLSVRGTGFLRSLPTSLTPGSIVFFDVGNNAVHEDFVTHAWIDNPLKHLLSLIPGFARTDNTSPDGKR